MNLRALIPNMLSSPKKYTFDPRTDNIGFIGLASYE